MNTIQSKALIGLGTSSARIDFIYCFSARNHDFILMVTVIDLYSSLICTGSIGDVPVLLAKPQTYMNFSGEAVSFIMHND